MFSASLGLDNRFHRPETAILLPSFEVNIPALPLPDRETAQRSTGLP